MDRYDTRDFGWNLSLGYYETLCDGVEQKAFDWSLMFFACLIVWGSKTKKHFTQSLVENSSQVQRSSDPGAWMANLDQLVIFIHIYFQTHFKKRCVPLHMYVTFFFTCRWENMLIYPFLIQNSPDFCIFVIFFAALAWVFLLWVLSCAEEHVHNSCSLHWTHKDNVRRTWNK